MEERGYSWLAGLFFGRESLLPLLHVAPPLSQVYSTVSHTKPENYLKKVYRSKKQELKVNEAEYEQS